MFDFRKNIGDLPPFLQGLGISFLTRGRGVTLATHAQSLFGQSSGTKCCKTAFDKITSTKIP